MEQIQFDLICKIFEENDFNSEDSIIDIMDSNQNIVIPTRSFFKSRLYNFFVAILFLFLVLSFLPIILFY